MVVQKVFCDSLFLLRARSKKLLITSIMTQRYHRIAAGTYFSYLKAFPSFSSGCPRMTNQLFSECNQGVLPSKSVTGDWLSDMLFLGHHLDQNELKKCWYLPPFWICISFKKKLTIILWSRQNITNPQFWLSLWYMTSEVETKWKIVPTSHSQMFQKVESGWEPIFKVVLEC